MWVDMIAEDLLAAVRYKEGQISNTNSNRQQYNRRKSDSKHVSVELMCVCVFRGLQTRVIIGHLECT